MQAEIRVRLDVTDEDALEGITQAVLGILPFMGDNVELVFAGDVALMPSDTNSHWEKN